MCKDDKGAKSFPLPSPECVTGCSNPQGVPATSLLPSRTSWLGWAGRARELPHQQPSPSKKIPFSEGRSPVVRHHRFVISSLPAIPGILHEVPLAQNSASGRVRGSTWTCPSSQIMSSNSQSGAFLVGRQKDFYGIRAVKFCGGLS